MDVGSVESLWRYPVKSMLGETLDAAEFTERSIAGDRAYAFVDMESGKVVSAKNPRKWTGLLDCGATYPNGPDGPAAITLPNGTAVLTDVDGVDETFTEFLGHAVRIARTAPAEPTLEEYWPDIEGLALRETVTDEKMPPGTFFDLAVVHVLTTATLAALSELYPDGGFEVRRFRPNVVVDTGDAQGFVENDWLDRTLELGDVRLRITGPCPRCVMTTLAQGNLPKDPGILRTAAAHNGANVGVYASIERGGTVRHGDPVVVV